MEALGLYALTLAATVAVEAPLVAGLCRRSGWRRAGEVAVLANLASHPAATALASMAGVGWGLAELLVVVFEALVLRRVLGATAGRSWAASVIANGLTAAIAIGAAGA